jgi:ERCC4-type nuclease
MAKIVADSREPIDGVPRRLIELGIAVERRVLWAGDYEVGDRAIVERKTVRGLHAAIAAGTFWPQIRGVRNAAKFPYLLIEGNNLDDGPLGAAAIRGVCVALMDLGVNVLRSSDPKDSALWLHRLAERRAHVRYRNRPAYAQRPKREAGAPAAEAALASVPGISCVGARALLSHFGSLSALVEADPSEWQRVRGIGPARANAIAATFHAEYTASRSRRSRERRGRAT